METKIKNNNDSLESILASINSLPSDTDVRAEGYANGYEDGKTDWGVRPPESDVLDPNEVYRTMRPTEWLPLPTPNDKEIYCLGQIPKGLKGYFSAKIYFYTGACTVEFGTVRNGVFVAKESVSPTNSTRFYKELNYADYEDELSCGRRQFVVRITGENISGIDFIRKELNIPEPLIVDAVVGIPLTSQCNFGDINAQRSTIGSLRFLRFVGKGKPGIMSGAFVQGCRSVLAVSCEAENDSVYNKYAFHSAQSLIAASPSLFKNATNYAYAFTATALNAIKCDAKPTGNCVGTFRDSKLARFDKDTLDTSACEVMSYFFYQCSCLSEITDFDISSAINLEGTFGLCYAVSRLTFAGETTPGGITIDLKQTSLGHDALVEMFNSLPSAINAATLAITNNPGATELTEEEIAIATSKNWTVSL